MPGALCEGVWGVGVEGGRGEVVGGGYELYGIEQRVCLSPPKSGSVKSVYRLLLMCE